MTPTHRAYHRKLANWLALLTIATLLLSGIALPPAQAAPDAPQATTVIAALSDYGSGTTLEQTVATMIAGWNPARIVTAGDNYHYQSCNSYATCVGAYYGTYVTAQTFMPTMGNHDYDNPPVGLTAYNNYFTWLPTSPDSQRRWYDFVVGDVHFFMLDGNGNQATQSTWLSTAVPQSTSVWNIAIIHQAPYSTGYYGDISASQLPYGTYGIDFVISGHNHHYERLVKADGGKTVRYFIDGYGGSLPTGLGHSQCGGSSAAVSEVCLANTPGAMKITASGTSITFEYYSSTGALQNTYTQVIGPEITTSVSSLSPFNTPPGTPSAAQTYTVSGSDLTADISINAPAGFAIKTDSGAYGSSITLPRTGGVVNPTTISVRLTGAAGGSFSGNIVHTSSGATQKDVAVSGIVGTAPTCVTSRISASADDAEERVNTGATNGAVDLDGDTNTKSLQMYRAYGGSTTDLNWWGLRFQSVNVPQGATITSADVTFRANLASGTTASGMTLWGQLATSPATFTASANNITGRTRTSASATWSVPAWTSGSDYATPDVSAIVQEIVNQSGWAANNALVVIGQTTVTQNRSAISRDSTNGSTLAPLLEVCYTTAPAGPTITTNGTLSPFSTTPGIPSAAQTYTVLGSNLTANISISAPAGFELSTNGSTYASGLTLTQSGGAVGATTIYARLTGVAEGSFSGNITHTSAGATTKNVAVSGTVSLCTTASFQQGTASYAGARDTDIQQANVTYNYGAATTLMVDSDEPNSSGNDVSALLYWDISAIPAGSTVESAAVTVYVENVTDATPGFNMYAMTQAWTEGTGNGSATGDGATWNTYNGTTAWPGGAGGSSDRGTTALANFAATATGSYQVSLNSTGLTVLAGWINAPTDNKGFMVYAGTEDNGLDFTSKNGSTVANRPKLTVSYCLPPTTPYIVTSGTLSAFSSSRNVPSAEQSYTVSGGNLTDNIVITAPADFQVSTTSGGPFGSSVSLTPNGSGTVAATTIYVRFLRSTLGTSTSNITHTSAGATTRNVAVTGTAVNRAPTITLVQPTDNATGVSIPPGLQAAVTDPDADTMNVSFYGRVAGEGTGEDFTLVVIPDTQNMSTSYPAVFNSMTQWIVAQKTTQNIVFATHVGDIVNTASNTTQWTNADTAMDYLDTGTVSYSVGPGNHDLGGSYNTYFGPSRFEGKSYYQGSYASGQNENNYSFFSAGGMDFILINLQYNSTSAHLDWADALLKANPGRRGIVEQHNILNTDNSWNNQAPYTALSDNPNLFMMLCGHMHAPNDGAAYRAETRAGMQTVHILMVDYQDFANGGDGWMRILKFLPATDIIDVSTYSPYLSQSRSGDAEDMELAYDMTAGAAFELIGTVTGVASGSNASISWPGRNPSTEYEWYAVASDGTTSTTSATWSFTTGTGTAAVPQKPQVTSITQSSGNVTLAWNLVNLDINGAGTSVLKYQVYGSQDPYFTSGGSLLGEPTTTTFPHAAGSTGMTSWYYRVRAVNSAGPSDYSLQRPGWFQFTLVPGS